MQGSGSSQDAGIIPLAVQAVLRGLSIVPKHKYRLSATYCGLSTGHDAQLVDLLATNPAAAVASLRDGSAPSALASLTSWSVEEPADILEVGMQAANHRSCSLASPPAAQQACSTK